MLKGSLLKAVQKNSIDIKAHNEGFRANQGRLMLKVNSKKYRL